MKKNRNLLLGMFAAVGLLLATSCSQDELDTAQSGNEAQVTFSLGLENNIGTRTRAISDGKSADKLVYAVFDAEGNRISTIEKVEKSGVTFPTTETLTLAKGQTYKVAFWAQDGDCEAYTVDNNMNVTVSYDNSVNNDEKRDAFFKTETFTVTGSTSIDVTLKRPFAQINVGVTTDDWDKAVASGIEIETSKVVIKNAATSINLLDGTVSGEAEVTYNLVGIPDENLLVDVDKDGEKENYKWLSMSYILTGAEKSTLEDLEFTFHPKSGNDIVFKEGLANVPVQRNWRTNILGQILTGNIDVNILIDAEYEDDYNVTAVVSTADELSQALSNPDITKITLTSNLENTGALDISSGKEINLNNKTLNVSYIDTRAPLVIKNGNVSATSHALRGYANADITLDNVNVTSTSSWNVIELGYINGSDRDCGNARLTLTNSTINASGEDCAGILIHGAQNKVKIENSTINHKYFGITQNGIVPGSEIELINVNISGTYSGIYLSNYADGAKNILKVTGGAIHSNAESAIEVKKTDITVKDVTLSSSATSQSYSLNGGGSNGIGYGIVLAGYKNGVAYEGETSFENITYNLAAQGDNVIKIIKYNGTTGENYE